jgi:hypothetical protein
MRFLIVCSLFFLAFPGYGQSQCEDSLAQQRFREIWETPLKSTDTLHFTDLKSLTAHVVSYLNYLTVLGYPCDNGMCNHSNTYKYEISFTAKDSVFTVSKVIESPDYSHCDLLNQYVKKLITIFPAFTVDGITGELKMPFIYRPD